MRSARAGPNSPLRGLLWACVTGALLVAAFIGYCAFTLPLSGGIAADLTPAAIVLTAADGQVFAAQGVSKGDRVAADQLPPDLVHAVIAIEDRRFYAHHAIDVRGILRAAWHNVHGEGPPQGASTITQQLARMSYLSPERSLRRKVQEALIALWLEARVSKDEILARYLNTAYFGAGLMASTLPHSDISAKRQARSTCPRRRCWRGWSARPRSWRRTIIPRRRAGALMQC